MAKPIVIVGGGLAGLACASRLKGSGADVLVLEADSQVGGKLRTEQFEGFTLDRGFQVFPTSYPTAQKLLNIGDLRVKEMTSGAKVWDGKRFNRVQNWDPSTIFSSFIPMEDKLRAFQLDQDLRRMSHDECLALDGQSGREWLKSRGLSEAFISRFAEPFLGCIFLDRTLGVSAGIMAFIWKMMSAGPVGVPAEGLGAIPAQLADGLPDGTVRTGAPVEKVEQGKVTLKDGEEVEAEAVVVACDAPEAIRLTGAKLEQGSLEETTIYYDAPEPIGTEPILMLNGTSTGRMCHFAIPSNAYAGFAPEGRHLIAATILEIPTMDDNTLARAVRFELGEWFGQSVVEAWKPLKAYRIRRAQSLMRPGFWNNRAGHHVKPGIWLAGEATVHCSIEGALRSGVECADELLLESAVPA